MEIKPFKIKGVTSSQSKIIQECLFKNGYTWSDGETCIQRLDNETMAFYKYGLKVEKNITDEMFNSILCKEITFEEFQTKYITSDQTFTRKQMIKFAEYYSNNAIDFNSTEEVLNEFLKNK